MGDPDSIGRARKSIAAQRRWALSTPAQRQKQTQAAREAFYAKFLTQVDEAVPGLTETERHRRAGVLMSAHFQEMRIRSQTSARGEGWAIKR